MSENFPKPPSIPPSVVKTDKDEAADAAAFAAGMELKKTLEGDDDQYKKTQKVQMVRDGVVVAIPKKDEKAP